ncbi:hypothetical protein [Synechococcus sp. MIT S9451]|uniref:hypothetical protein n=1 Tax=Synechococcus sp. MIT S9451 TaxID=3082543 RepID=UPI0039B4C146
MKAFRFGTELLIRMPRFAGAPADAGVRLSTAPLEVVEASPFSFVGSCPLLLAAGLLLDQQRLLKCGVDAPDGNHCIALSCGSRRCVALASATVLGSEATKSPHLAAGAFRFSLR